MKKNATEAERRALISASRRNTDISDLAAPYLARLDGRLLANFPNSIGIRTKGPIDISAFDDFPGIGQALADGYVLHCIGVKAAETRYQILQLIKTGFLKFLRAANLADISLDKIDSDLVIGFKKWLDLGGSTGIVLAKVTRRATIQSLQSVLRQLMVSSKWRPYLNPDLTLLAQLYPGAHRDIEHTAVLDEGSRDQMYDAAAGECEAIIRRIEAFEARLAEMPPLITLAEVGSDLERTAAWSLSKYPCPLPSYEDLRRESVKHARAIDSVTYEAAERLLYPDIDELVPFVLLLTLLFALNPTVIFNMTITDFDFDTFGGRERIRLHPMKRRAHSRQRNWVVATEDFDNPARLLRFLEKRTERLRGAAQVEFGDRLFLRFGTRSRRVLPLRQSDLPWREAQARFCDRHGLDRFEVRQLRPTTLDLVHEVTDGDLLAVQAVAHHTSPNTTLAFYESDAMRKRGEEFLGAGLSHLQRKVATGGRVDPTTLHRVGLDMGAATPGFGCLDPHDSPIPGEEGRLCGAYGRCPICPLKIIDETSPHAYAYQRNLLARIDDAKLTLGPAWLSRWARVRDDLVSICLKRFSPDTAASGLRLAIPDLPPVE